MMPAIPPANAATPISPLRRGKKREEKVSKHDQIYNTLLMVLGFMFFMTAGVMLTMSGTASDDGKWVFRMTAFVAGCYVLAVAATLIVRFTAPSYRRTVTRAMNILLLLHFPLGSAVGVYGLLKADRPDSPAISPPLPRAMRDAARPGPTA
jgi:hypothetical protein